MTTPTPAGTGAVARAMSSPRALAAWASVGYAGLVLFFAFIDWILPGGDGTFSGRSASADFVGTYTLALPVLAVLLAAHVTPASRGSEADRVHRAHRVRSHAVLRTGNAADWAG